MYARNNVKSDGVPEGSYTVVFFTAELLHTEVVKQEQKYILD